MAAVPKKAGATLKPAKKPVAAPKPAKKQKVAASLLHDGFVRISEVKIRKVYK